MSVAAVDRQVLITYADNGPGLDEITAGHAFERGYRGPASEGSGLGLHDARELMRSQGGDVEIDRGPDTRGARFVVTLPAPAAALRRVPAQRSGSESLQHLDLQLGSAS